MKSALAFALCFCLLSDFRVLKILPSDLDEIEDIKQVGNEYFFKKGIEVIDESENEIVPELGEGQPSINEANNQFTETLDIVVLPPPTKDADVYESEVDASSTTVGGSAGGGDGTTINLVELITPTMVTRMQVTSQTQEFLDVHIRSTAGIPVEVTRSGETNATGGVTATTLGSVEREGILERYPDVESNEVEEDARANKSSPSEEEFSFNNSTFKKMQKAVLEEINVVQNGDGVRGAYPGNYDDDDEDDFEDEDDDSDDFDDSERRGHKKYISIQRTLLKHPLRQGFLMTPGYPKYYIGDSVCRWTLYAQRHQKIKLTILDLALRFDEPCRDYVEIRDLESNQTLFSSCSESTRPIVVVSVRERVEINVRTTTKVAYPKRGVLIHYSALGCELPSPIPPHMTLVRRSEYRAKYVCDPLYVFPDTAEPSRELVCTAKHTWNRPLPACVEKRATEGSGLVSHYEQKRKISDSETMSDNKADTVYDIVIPSMIIAALFIVNGIVFAVIMRYRNKRKQRLELDSKELAEL